MKAKVKWVFTKGTIYEAGGLIGSPGKGPGEFTNPRGIAVDNAGSVYVVDVQNRNIQVFDEKGKYSFQIGNGFFNRPWSVAVDKNKNVYVSDWQNAQYGSGIAKFDKTGTLLKFFKGGGALTDTPDLVVDAQEAIYVINQEFSKASFIKIDAQEQVIFNLPGPFWHPFLLLAGIALHPSGGLPYLSDRNSERVYE